MERIDSSQAIRLVVTCTNRKTLVAPQDRLMRNVPGDPRDRLALWTEIVESKLSDSSPSVPARELYGGDHWSVIESIPPVVGPWQIELWVASAGLGLIPASAEIKSYGATFSSGTADSVCRGVPAGARNAYNAAWWRGLADRNGSITELAQSNPTAPLVFTGSPAYLAPLTGDLTSAAAVLTRESRMFVITSGSISIPGAMHLRVEDRLASPEGLGGSLVSLNARVTRWLIGSAIQHSFDPDAIGARFSDLLRSCPDRKRFDRKRVETEVVRDFIRSEFRLAASERRQPLSNSALLRAFRNSGLACEQKKFGILYLEIASEESTENEHSEFNLQTGIVD